MTDRELLNCLTDRPCDVCKFRGENGCSQWTCVFCDDLFGDMRTEQETGNDLIRRDAVVYYIKGYIHEIITESGEDKNAHTNRVLRAIINGVETMPPVNHKTIINNGIMDITL